MTPEEMNFYNLNQIKDQVPQQDEYYKCSDHTEPYSFGSNEWRAYRNGVRFALREIMNMYGDCKYSKDKIPIRVDLLALYYGLDAFIEYGDNTKIKYTSWDKKKVPTAGVAMGRYEK